MKIGDRVPQNPFAATSQVQKTFPDYEGKWLVLYFYPKDSTPGCTMEGRDFRDAYLSFQQLDAEIFGISRDNLKAHETFKQKQGFPFELISDANETLCEAFDVMRLKNMYGKEVRGIERSTFLINPQGHLVQAWRKVNVKGHVADVLAYLQRAQS